MLPKIASALARVLDPIKPMARPGQTVSLMKSAEGGHGGYGSLGYEGPPDEEPPEPKKSDVVSPSPSGNEGAFQDHPQNKRSVVPFQPGLTQMIIDLNATRVERSAGAAAHSYETGAKEQKKNARLPKGSMLDKKVG